MMIEKIEIMMGCFSTKTQPMSTQILPKLGAGFLIFMWVVPVF